MSAARPLEQFASQEVIRPAVVLTEHHARQILTGLVRDDVRTGGHWWTRVGTWRRYEHPWRPGDDDPGDVPHLGSLSCVYDSPTRYCVTVFRVSLTAYGLERGWTTASLCDDAFRHAGLSFAECPRADMREPPVPFAHLEVPRLDQRRSSR